MPNSEIQIKNIKLHIVTDVTRLFGEISSGFSNLAYLGDIFGSKKWAKFSSENGFLPWFDLRNSSFCIVSPNSELLFEREGEANLQLFNFEYENYEF